MNWEQKIERIAARARAEEPPRIDVMCGVLSLLRTDRVQSATLAERFWMWLAVVSSAVAVPAAAAAIILYMRSVEPLSELAEAISWAVQ